MLSLQAASDFRVRAGRSQMLNLRVVSGLLLLPMAIAFGTFGHSPVASAAGYGDWNAIHRQMGATGKNGYRPMTSRAYPLKV